MPSITLATNSKPQNQTHTLNYPVAHTQLLTIILALPLILQVALHKSENKSTVRILALYSVKIISHINRIKANLDIEGKGIDWFSNISQNQDFVLLGPRTLLNLPTTVEGGFGCRAPLQGLASITVKNNAH